MRVAAQMEVRGAVGESVGEGEALGEGANQGHEAMGVLLGSTLFTDEGEGLERQIENEVGVLGPLVEKL
jgi:hypothetical protein